MADPKPTPKRTKVPPPKKTYPDPATEPRSNRTQAAADRYLSGVPTIADEAAEIDKRKAGA
jgi:hypothetical protein